MTSTDQTVTVCVPVHQGEGFVARTLRSVQQQTHTDLRVLVSVDRSTDMSLQVCRRFLDDPRFTVIEQPGGLGWVGNSNWLLGKVETPYGCLMPHDDLLHPTYLRCLLAHLDRHPEAAIAYCDIRAFGRRWGRLSQPPVDGADPLGRCIEFIAEHHLALPFRGVIRRKALDGAGQIPERSGGDLGADQAWLARVAYEGTFVRVPSALYRKRYHAGAHHRIWRSLSPEQRDAAWIAHCVAATAPAMRLAHDDAARRRVLTAGRVRVTQMGRVLAPGVGRDGAAMRDRAFTGALAAELGADADVLTLAGAALPSLSRAGGMARLRALARTARSRAWDHPHRLEEGKSC